MLSNKEKENIQEPAFTTFGETVIYPPQKQADNESESPRFIFKNESKIGTESTDSQENYCYGENHKSHLCYSRLANPREDTISINNKEPIAMADFAPGRNSNHFSVELDDRHVALLCNLSHFDAVISPDTEYFDIDARLVKVQQNLQSVEYLDDHSNIHDQYALQCLNEDNGILIPISQTSQNNQSYASSSSETELLEIRKPIYRQMDLDMEDNAVHNDFCQKLLDSSLSSNVKEKEIQRSAYLSEEDITQEMERLKLCVVKSQIQEEWMKGEKSVDEMTKFMDQYLTEDTLETDSDSFDDDDGGGGQEDTEHDNSNLQHWSGMSKEEEILVCQLSLTKQCRRPDCQRPDCLRGKKLYEIIHNGLEDDRGYRFIILSAIVKHSRQCNECCNVPHCSFFKENDWEDSSISDMVLSFDEEFNGPQVDLKVSSSDEFVSLDQGYVSMPEQGVHYEIHSRLNESVFFGTCYCISEENSRLRHLIVKKAICDESMEELLPCIKQIQARKSPENLVRSFWAINCSDSKLMYFTSGFEAKKNLQQFILNDHPHGIPRNILVPIVNSLYSALQFLKDNDILYLNWQTDHVLLCDGLLKLCNFTTAIVGSTIEEKEEDYFEDICDKLPPFVVPPELYEGLLYFPTSDYWGFGCILYEMVTGKCVHWENHYLTIEEQRDKIKSNPRPAINQLGSNLNDVKDILEKCFSINKEGRILSIPESLLL